MHHVVIHYNEIGLKGRNRPLFLRRLEANLLQATAGTGIRRVDERSGRLVLPLPRDADWSTIRERLRCVFGVANFSLADRSDLEMSALESGASGIAWPSAETVKRINEKGWAVAKKGYCCGLHR